MRSDVGVTSPEATAARLPKLSELMLKRQDVGQALKLSLTVVDQLIKAGELPSVMIGGSRRVRMTDLLGFINNLKPEIDRKPSYRLGIEQVEVLVLRPDLQSVAA